MTIKRFAAFLVAFGMVASACSSGEADTLTVYSGRSEDLIGPLVAQFEEASGITVEVRYSDSAELAATILEEGDNSPADVFFSQDPASIGAVANAGLLTTLGDATLGKVPSGFSDVNRQWVGVSGRSRVMVYNTSAVTGDLPVSVDALGSDEWAGRVAIAPTNGSFLAFVAAMILLEGEDATLRWLEAMESAPTYSGNSVIVSAVANGEVDAGLVNHYYLLRLIDEQGDVEADNWFFPTTGAGALVMPAGTGILATSDQPDAAAQFVEFLLSDDAQRYFADETFEYPLVPNIEANPALPPLQSLQQPDIDLSELADVLDLATDLVARAGLL